MIKSEHKANRNHPRERTLHSGDHWHRQCAQRRESFLKPAAGAKIVVVEPTTLFEIGPYAEGLAGVEMITTLT
jgi:hypothetical protein